MGADYYPRLAGMAHDNAEINRLVNEQTEVALLLSAPIFIAMIGLSPWVIHLLYSDSFTPAIDVLRWQILGDVLKVASWPMGFILLAKGEKGWFFWNELLANVVSIGFLWGGIHFFGLKGTGIAFFALYAYQVVVILFVSKHLTGFSWHRNSKKLLLIATILLLITSLIAYRVNTHNAAVLGCVISAITAWYSLKEITRLTGRNPIEAFLGKIRNMLPGR